MRIGFIGLGVMGAPMARHLADAGHEIVTVLNRSPLPQGLTASVVASAAEVARGSEIVVTMLPDTPDVERVLLGEDEQNGAGQTCKIANQIIVALNIEAVAEALVFASKAGCDPAKVRGALMGGFAASRVLEVHGQRMIDRTFAPGFRIKLHQKDLNLALDSARALGVALPNTAMAQQLMNACSAHPGGAEADHSSLV
ncbi:MAG: hypothetical protein E5Y29_25755, partial [Mesorhizobium sp.]